ncbi:MAG: hypothetical protein HZB16_03080 [Armatimonadetes bacterium]|nr:hypothetical protein [Armatimonadota bacterium]
MVPSRAMRGLLVALAMLASGGARAGEGADLEFGGLGDGQGKFRGIADLTFGPDGLYVLDWTAAVDGNQAGNGLVQVFDRALPSTAPVRSGSRYGELVRSPCSRPTAPSAPSSPCPMPARSPWRVWAPLSE